jgi:hypothetical protein
LEKWQYGFGLLQQYCQAAAMQERPDGHGETPPRIMKRRFAMPVRDTLIYSVAPSLRAQRSNLVLWQSISYRLLRRFAPRNDD